MNESGIPRTFMTSIGVLPDLTTFETYPDGTLQTCMLGEPVFVRTPLGTWIPRWGEEEVRRKYNKALSFFPGGQLKSIALHEVTPVVTPQGTILAEHVVFYENGALHRVFPRNGKISGYWSEKDEKSLSSEYNVTWGDQSLTARVMIFRFYPSGSLRSLTFWPEDVYEIFTPAGCIPVRIGVSFYESGAIQSVEPAEPVRIPGADPEEIAYDMDAAGLHGDSNSLRFAPDGTVISCVKNGFRTMPLMDLCGDCSTCESGCGK